MTKNMVFKTIIKIGSVKLFETFRRNKVYYIFLIVKNDYLKALVMNIKIP